MRTLMSKREDVRAILQHNLCLFSSTPTISFWSTRTLGAQILPFFCVHKTNVHILSVLNSVKVGIMWVALCFTPFNFIIAALKIRY